MNSNTYGINQSKVTAASFAGNEAFPAVTNTDFLQAHDTTRALGQSVIDTELTNAVTEVQHQLLPLIEQGKTLADYASNGVSINTDDASNNTADSTHWYQRAVFALARYNIEQQHIAYESTRDANKDNLQAEQANAYKKQHNEAMQNLRDLLTQTRPHSGTLQIEVV